MLNGWRTVGSNRSLFRLPGDLGRYLSLNSSKKEDATMNDTNNQTKNFLPVWVWVIALLQIFLVLFFSAGTAMNPGDFIPGVTELNYVTQLYITRNVTVALGIIVALLLKSHKPFY